MSYVGIIERETIAEAWEELVLTLWQNGHKVPKYGKEMALLVKVQEPFKEPRVHRGDVNAVLGLDEYVEEVVNGIKDHLIGKTKSYPYTYHDRLANYPNDDGSRINQLKLLKQNIKNNGELTNRNQTITWIPSLDIGSKDPPCLQRVWCKIIDDKLVMHTTWRSRDGFGAWHMNTLAMTELQKLIGKEIGVPIGCYVDFSDSVHLYENKWEEIRRFVNVTEKRKKG